jgi:predicted nucleic acid-binding protein
LSRWYLDTSAALKLIVQEPESEALAGAIDQEQPDLVACLLLETELRRAVPRDPAMSQTVVTDLLEAVSLHELPPSLFTEAGLLPGAGQRSLDALHLGAAIRLGVDRVVTYDRRMARAADELGITVYSPS